MLCVSVGNIDFKLLMQTIETYEIIEVRLDLLNLTNQQFTSILEFSDKLILTYRVKNHNIDDAYKLLENAISYGVAYIDIANDDLLYYSEIIKDLRETNTKLIISHHDFIKTPGYSEILEIYQSIADMKPDIVKMCFKARESKDVVNTLRLYQLQDKLPLIAFNMGKIGTLSRVFAYKLGAPFMYTAINDESKTESSQLTYREFVELINLI
jgi:3-dehydroquinate dehydratase-1